MKKERLDKFLVDLGYFENKSKASAAILAGNVMIGTEVITKAGYQIDTSKEYDFKIKKMPYVSRGGFKLKKALDAFNFSPKDRICFDAGASTGGFTDCLLQNGAKFVYAVNVGYGQLDWLVNQTVPTGQWIPTTEYPETFDEFKISTKDPEYLAYAFLNRPF